MSKCHRRTLLPGCVIGAIFGCAPISFASEPGENQAACQAWCAENPECVNCSSHVGCGVGYKQIKSWRGTGKNWYACAKREGAQDVAAGEETTNGDSEYADASSEHEKACREWCAENPKCANCSSHIGCGVGFKRIKSWRGTGKNWYACAKR